MFDFEPNNQNNRLETSMRTVECSKFSKNGVHISQAPLGMAGNLGKNLTFMTKL